MSSDDRPPPDRSAQGFLLLVGILLAVVLAWGLGTLQGREDQRRDDTPAAYARAAKADAQRACAGREASAVFECVYEKVGSSYEQAHEEQDLSAQQRAAFANLVSAITAFFTLVLSGIALWFLKGTLAATRDAVNQAEDGTKAALIAAEAGREANRLSADTARRQLRAYLTVEPGGINEAVEGRVRVPLIVENVGDTPAHKVMAFSSFGLDPNPVAFDPRSLVGPEGWLSGEGNDATLGRGTRRYLYTYIRESFLERHLEAVSNKEMAIIHWGYVIYEDVFGEIHRTHFAFYHWGEELSDVTSLRCRFGNTAD
ncbi:MAG TPA: hypothetical protein VF605_10180 [Allosphingosinicella sp.]